VFIQRACTHNIFALDSFKIIRFVRGRLKHATGSQSGQIKQDLSNLRRENAQNAGNVINQIVPFE